ncbi:hypothetical protein [Rhizobium leucaenae]|nr:hypothetical protein [Rhizobium leucaenae]
MDKRIYGSAVKGYQAITSTMAAIDAKPNPETDLKPAIAGISLRAGS